MSNIFIDKFKIYLNETKSNKFYILLYLVLILIFSALFFDVVKEIHHIKFICLVLISLLILGVFLINYHTLHDKELYKTVFILVLFVGLFCALTNPILYAPDEAEHFERALLTSEGDLFPEYINNSYHSSEYFLTIFEDSSLTFFDSTHDSQSINDSSAIFNSAFQQNPFFGYLVAGLGIFLAKLFSLNLIWALWLPRIFNVLIYAICAAIAVKKAPFGKMLFVVMACLPLALFQASVISIDHLINGLALIIVAYALYFFKNTDKITKKDILIYLLLCIAIGLCKVTCFVFILFLLFLPIKKLKNKKILVYGIIAVAVSILIALLWSKFYATPLYLNSARLDYMLANNINQTTQMNFILTHKTFAFGVIANSLFTDFLNNIYLLNCFYPHDNITLYSPIISHLYLLFLGVLFIFYPLKEKLSINLRVSSLLLSVLYILGTIIIFYLTWTPVGFNGVQGIQSRYFIPIFLLFPFIINISSKFDLNKIKVDKVVIVLTIVFAVSVVLSNLFFYY